MNGEVDPAQALALAVGIERYAYGSEMDLPGAAEAACDFAEWALGRGIPPERVILACTWLEANPPVDLPFRPVQATAASLQATIAGLDRESGELLLMYWCGHGVLREGRERLLHTADAARGNLLSLSVDEMHRYLSSSRLTGRFRHQILLIDACANFLEEVGIDETVPTLSFPVGRPQHHVSQFSYFAAGQGETADYNRTRREATFSEAVLSWLQEHGSDRLPPDVAALRAHVDEVFAVKHAAGELRVRPVCRIVDPGSGSLAIHGDVPVSGRVHQVARGSILSSYQVRQVAKSLGDAPMLGTTAGRSKVLSKVAGGGPDRPDLEDLLPYFTTDSESQVRRRFGMLREHASTVADESAVRLAEACWRRQHLIAPVLALMTQVTPKQRREAFCRAAPEGVGRCPDGIEQALDKLADCEVPEGEQLPLHHMVARLEHTAGVAIPEGWYGLPPDRLYALRAMARAERPERASLVIDLRNPAGSAAFDWPTTVEGRLRVGDKWTSMHQVVGAAGVEEAVSRLVEEAQTSVPVQLKIGFIVPRAGIDRVPEGLTYTDPLEMAPIWHLYPAVLHCPERQYSARSRQAWRAKAEAIKAAVVNGNQSVHWFEANSKEHPAMITDGVRKHSKACFALAFAPGGFRGDLRVDPLIAAVKGGAPFVVWVEHEQPDWAHARAEIVELIEGGVFEEVPERVMEVRINDPDGLGSQIRLIWDDPEWLPPLRQLPGLISAGAADV